MNRAQTYQVPKGKTKNGFTKKESQPLAAAPRPLPEGELVLSFYDSTKTLLSTEILSLKSENEWETLSFSTKAEEKGFVSASIRGTSTEPAKFDDFSIQLKSLYSAKLYQENHYYPFGMNMKGLESSDKQSVHNKKEHEFQFNAQTEREESFGLFWDETPFRNYDSQLGRLWGVDLLSEIYPTLSPFQYAFNNPIGFNDPTGLIGEGFSDGVASLIKQAWSSTPKGEDRKFDSNGDGTFTSYFQKSFTPSEITGGLGEVQVGITTIGKQQENSSSTLEMVQMGIDAAGWIPGVQTVAGITSAGIDIYQGDYWGAAIGLASAIPVIGYAAKLAKGAKTIKKIAMIGEGQARVFKASKQFQKATGHKVRTITDDWPKELYFRNYNPEAHEAVSLEFNRKWINKIMDENYTIFDIGTDSRDVRSAFYKLELEEISKRGYKKHYNYKPKE